MCEPVFLDHDWREPAIPNWPRIGDERLSDIAGQWWQWHLEARAKWLGEWLAQGAGLLPRSAQ
jgi:hypothetical protein